MFGMLAPASVITHYISNCYMPGFLLTRHKHALN